MGYNLINTKTPLTIRNC